MAGVITKLNGHDHVNFCVIFSNFAVPSRTFKEHLLVKLRFHSLFRRQLRRVFISFLRNYTPHVTGNLTNTWILDLRCEFRILGTGFWIPYQWNLDSGFQ